MTSEMVDPSGGGAESAGAVERVFVIGDVRGYTRFTREHGDAEGAAVAMRFAGLARDAFEARGGHVIELRGDEALAVFESARQAVLAARTTIGTEPRWRPSELSPPARVSL